MTLWSPTFVAILNIYFALQNLTEALIAGWLAVFPLGCCRRWGEWPWSTILMQGECCLSEAKPWGWLSHWCQSAKGKRNKTKTSTTKMSVEPWVCVGCASAASSSSKVTSSSFTLSQKHQWELGISEENSASFCIWCTSIGTRCMQWVFEWFISEKKRGTIFRTSERPGEKLTEQVWKSFWNKPYVSGSGENVRVLLFSVLNFWALKHAHACIPVVERRRFGLPLKQIYLSSSCHVLKENILTKILLGLYLKSIVHFHSIIEVSVI